MNFNFLQLDKKAREYMLDELDKDILENNLYISNRLTAYGKNKYPEYLRDSIQNGDCVTLEKSLKNTGILESQESRAGKMVKVPITAAETLAEGEFNRFYIRAVCRRAIDEKKDKVIIYRAKQVSNPRPESLIAEGREVNPKVLLEDIRNNPGNSVYIPSGPNSGLSVRY